MAGEEPAGTEAERITANGLDTALLSRILVTWFGLVAVGFTGALVGGNTSGPPQFVAYLVTTLLSVAVLLYNVDRLVAARTG
ncbi:hypothetical protein N0B31_15365 [Salinirubellus salinus]|uniref:Uncharacterized protein n=1 Tax=Salinirubellus salinus TaxID=1364945 RepID=A0A9E7R293_9EURY|nr:hypothetical protein [Salinirubellus salinus]UWM53513.1 hypothetical protein N0B31_15365 [Salinirubellus salinus]